MIAMYSSARREEGKFSGNPKHGTACQPLLATFSSQVSACLRGLALLFYVAWVAAVTLFEPWVTLSALLLLAAATSMPDIVLGVCVVAVLAPLAYNCRTRNPRECVPILV